MEKFKQVPNKVIKILSSLGLPMSESGNEHSGPVIAVASELCEKVLVMLYMLSPMVEADVYCDLSDRRDSDKLDDSRDPSGPEYFHELQEYLPNVNPGHPSLRGGGVRGEGRTLVEAVVKMVEAPPQCCPLARAVEEGVYMLTLVVKFPNLALLVPVHRKAPTV